MRQRTACDMQIINGRYKRAGPIMRDQTLEWPRKREPEVDCSTSERGRITSAGLNYFESNSLG
jgi:hypothetical protein